MHSQNKRLKLSNSPEKEVSHSENLNTSGNEDKKKEISNQESSGETVGHNNSELKKPLEGEDDNNETLDDVDVDEMDKDDPFALHFETEISDDMVSNIEKKQTKNEKVSFNILRDMRFMNFVGSPELSHMPLDLKQLYVKPNVMENIPVALTSYQKTKSSTDLSPFQLELLSIMCNYHDLFYTERTFANCEDIRLSYCLHALNHVMKTRSRIVHHNQKLAKNRNELSDYRDQGLARSKVLILVPFKESALRVVNMIIKLLMPGKKGNVLNKKRFKMEFMNSEDETPSRHDKRPADFNAIFAGNIDDSFRVGITVTRKSLRLYSDFYSSDIIVASPLGLRTVIGAEGDKERDYDFLSSIEMLILDQADVFLMQNWEHILHILQHLHLQPSKARNTDFSRIRMWTLNGWSKHYRQTMLFSHVNHPLLSAVFNRSCSNFAGRFTAMSQNATPTLNQVLLQVPQVFHRFEPSSLETLPEDRFKFFVNKVLNHFKDPVMSHTLIYIPSYFDFVRLRNYMKKEEMSFTQICEYSKKSKVARARDMFFHGQKHFLLFTERFHFYHRYIIKGIRHIIFYELPTYANFYSEMVNFLHPQYQAKQKKSS